MECEDNKKLGLSEWYCLSREREGEEKNDKSTRIF